MPSLVFTELHLQPIPTLRSHKHRTNLQWATDRNKKGGWFYSIKFFHLQQPVSEKHVFFFWGVCTIAFSLSDTVAMLSLPINYCIAKKNEPQQLRCAYCPQRNLLLQPCQVAPGPLQGPDNGLWDQMCTGVRQARVERHGTLCRQLARTFWVLRMCCSDMAITA